MYFQPSIFVTLLMALYFTIIIPPHNTITIEYGKHVHCGDMYTCVCKPVSSIESAVWTGKVKPRMLT